jgi:hypothetical protein
LSSVKREEVSRVTDMTGHGTEAGRRLVAKKSEFVPIAEQKPAIYIR